MDATTAPRKRATARAAAQVATPKAPIGWRHLTTTLMREVLETLDAAHAIDPDDWPTAAYILIDGKEEAHRLYALAQDPSQIKGDVQDHAGHLHALLSAVIVMPDVPKSARSLLSPLLEQIDALHNALDGASDTPDEGVSDKTFTTQELVTLAVKTLGAREPFVFGDENGAVFDAKCQAEQLQALVHTLAKAVPTAGPWLHERDALTVVETLTAAFQCLDDVRAATTIEPFTRAFANVRALVDLCTQHFTKLEDAALFYGMANGIDGIITAAGLPRANGEASSPAGKITRDTDFTIASAGAVGEKMAFDITVEFESSSKLALRLLSDVVLDATETESVDAVRVLKTMAMRWHKMNSRLMSYLAEDSIPLHAAAQTIYGSELELTELLAREAA